MPTITGQSAITRAATLIQDATNVRWPRIELLDWLNDGQREVVLLKPEACVITESLVLATNVTRQTIPANSIMLFDVVRNMGTNGSTVGDAIRVISREVLDAQRPSWHADANTLGKIQHYMFDPRVPKTFYVYPKAPATAWSVEIVTSAAPPAANDSGGAIGIDDIYANALLDYILYRAYSKDADYAQNAQLALAHYTAFANSLGIKHVGEMARNPNLLGGQDGNPNVPRAAR